jgi:hypothetical protein
MSGKKHRPKNSTYNTVISTKRTETTFETLEAKQKADKEIKAHVRQFIKNGGKIQKINTRPKPEDYRFILKARAFETTPTTIH